MALKEAIRSLHGVLEISTGYSFLLVASRAIAGRRVFMKDYSQIQPGNRVLEIGCGPGTNLEFMPEGTQYTGCDYNAEYIEFAQKKYRGKATFVCLSVDDLPAANLGEFDVALVIGVLHHITDDQVRAMAKGAQKVLRKGGSLLVWEPCWTETQSTLDRFMLSIDRGRHVRTATKYALLLEETFGRIETEFLMTPKILWPQSGCILRAVKAS